METHSRRIRGCVSILATLFALPLLAQTSPITVDGTPGTRSAVQAPHAKPVRPVVETYGTTYRSYTRIDVSEMTPLASANTYYCINNCQLRYLTNVSGLGLMTPVHLPSGAQITYVEIDYYDNSTTGEVQASLAVCDYAGQSCVFQPGDGLGCPDGSIALCSGNTNAPGYDSAASEMGFNNIFIDNYYSRYFFFVGNTTNDGSTAISQIIVGYNLRVSPAPATATFNDVPTSHPFFQFIEALSASGITGGCGGSNYCPDSPVTRGQMAVFLSKALGLYFQ